MVYLIMIKLIKKHFRHKFLTKSSKAILSIGNAMGLGSEKTARYWTSHNVTSHYRFQNASESLEYFNWRNDQYFNYINLMPVCGQDDKHVLDYGCGPGHDLVGFGVFSKTARLTGIDLSESSLAEARDRLDIHNIDAELILLDSSAVKLPLADNSFDYIHSSGVLHHVPDPVKILLEFSRILKPGGVIRVMVYNYDSLWLHLYVAYHLNILKNKFTDESILDQFRRSTDGKDCPISNCYRSVEWIGICEQAGFSAEFIGAAVSMHEMNLLPSRYAAIQDRRLRTESRKFLMNLHFDEKGYPLYEGHYAGVDGCFLLTKLGD